MRAQKLKSIIRYAYEKVPFYVNKGIEKQIFEYEDVTDILKRLPVIEKEEVIKQDNLFSVDYTIHHDEDLLRVDTSGSTGKCMKILWDKYDMNKSMLPLWLYRLKYYGIKMNDKFCYFYTLGNNRESIESLKDYEENENCLGFSKNNLTEAKILEIYMHMKKYAPIWINMQPSIGMLLAKCIKKNKLDKISKLKYIELTGEMLFDNVRKEIEEAFGCKVANQYGCYEANSIAYECPCGKLHCMEDNIYVEIVNELGKEKKDGEEGNIVITTLNSHMMPFIRYKVGDKGKIVHNPRCSCGNKSPILELTSGRISDYAILKDGSRINSYVFVRAINMVNMVYKNVIKQFQIIQKDYDYFLINLILDDDIIDSEDIMESIVEDSILASIKDERLYDTEFGFEYYDDLFPNVLNGKLKYFISEVK